MTRENDAIGSDARLMKAVREIAREPNGSARIEAANGSAGLVGALKSASNPPRVLDTRERDTYNYVPLAQRRGHEKSLPSVNDADISFSKGSELENARLSPLFERFFFPPY